MLKALALGHVTFDISDLEKSLVYYQDVLGLQVIDRLPGKVYLASRSGSEALLLQEAKAAKCTGFRFQVTPTIEMSDVLGQLTSLGIKADMRNDPHPDVTKSVIFTDLNGFEVELASDRKYSPPAIHLAIAPLRLGHIALVVPDSKRTSDFYADILGFRVADWIGDFFVFMRCGHEHHTINFLKAPTTAMHHVAFEVRNSAHLHASCDQLAEADIGLVWGPVRHGPGHNIATYHKNADGHLVELFTEMDIVTNEDLGYYDPRPWHADRPQRPKVWSPSQPRDIWGPQVPENFLLGNM